MSELLPCPFCGELPIRVSHLKSYEQSTHGRFRCETFDCPISGLTINERMWNQRSDTDVQAAFDAGQQSVLLSPQESTSE